VQFSLPQSAQSINVQAGTGAANDANGGATATSGNNPSAAAVGANITVPTMGWLAMVLLLAATLLLAAHALRRTHR
jgi:hypothetical protein